MSTAGAAVRQVPFVDLRPQHDELRDEIEAVFRSILDDSAFVGGAHVEGFEDAFAKYVGAGHAVGVASGTDAVRIALQVAGVQPGDAVVTVSHTFIATAEAVTQIGALPLFVDIERDTQTMDPAALESFLGGSCERASGGTVVHRPSGRRVAAIVPVHLYGQSADMEPLLRLAAGHGIPVVEDAAQAHGATYRFADGAERACGSMGAAAAFSFYPGKNLGAIGEAGAVVTNDEAWAARARVLRDHGQARKYVHVTAEGGNARLDALQAAVLRLKLGRLDGWNDGRRRAARRYDEALEGADVERPIEAAGRRHVYHLYVIRASNRDALAAELGEAGVATGLHYPVPVHRQEAYAGLETVAGALPETEAAAREVLSLPMYAHLSDSDTSFVAEQLRRLRP